MRINKKFLNGWRWSKEILLLTFFRNWVKWQTGGINDSLSLSVVEWSGNISSIASQGEVLVASKQLLGGEGDLLFIDFAVSKIIMEGLIYRGL